MNTVSKCATAALGAMLAVAGMSWSGDLNPSAPGDLFAQAEARVGRPLTPVSYAGVARRTTRRAVAVGAAAAPPPSTTVVVTAPAPAPTYPPECVQSVDSTGATVYRCP
ncbi:MAG: hypothetical protein ACXWUP_08630 [Allosphingosinicella sp.]